MPGGPTPECVTHRAQWKARPSVSPLRRLPRGIILTHVHEVLRALLAPIVAPDHAAAGDCATERLDR
jgi:hypothetical protein